jgi:hypothetical protein
MTWAEFHAESEKFASAAELAAKRGDVSAAYDLYRQAADAEVRALVALDEKKVRTLGITAVSAVALSYKAHDFTLAERLAHKWLATDLLPDFSVEQLQTLLQMMWNDVVREKAGVKFTGGEVLISVKGGEIVTGGAPLELIVRKVEEVRNIFYRTAEMLLTVPHRKRGPASAEIQDTFRPWLFQAAPGSYQFAVCVQEPPQMELFPKAKIEAEKIAAKFIDIVKASIEDPEGALPEVVPDPEYRKTFLRMTRNLAPTGDDFGRLEVRPSISPTARPIVLLPTAREAIGQILRKQASTAPLGAPQHDEVQLMGVLRGLQLDQDWIEVTVEGQTVRITGAGDQVDDVLGPMVNRRVIVDAYRTKPGKIILNDIRPAG